MSLRVIVPVFWSSAVNSEVIQKMASFYGDIVQTPYWSWLQEYNTVGLSGGSDQSILPGSLPAAPFNNGVTLGAVEVSCTTSKCTISDARSSRASWNSADHGGQAAGARARLHRQHQHRLHGALPAERQR